MINNMPVQRRIIPERRKMAQIRLDKFISERTEYTRSQIKQLAAKGSVKVDGTAVKRADVKIDPETAAVSVCGTEISAQRYRYILLNNPEGYVCSTNDNDGESVMKLVPPEMRTKNMFPAGRLDKDSLGALLITDDGGLAHRMLAPKSHVPKIYIVKLDRPFQSNYVDLFKNGVALKDNERCLPAKVKSLENTENMAFIEICEGKYHQVKRMFAAVGNNVEKLMRVSVGGLVLPEKLGKGECMELLHKDVENLLKPQDFELFCARFSRFFSANLINNL